MFCRSTLLLSFCENPKVHKTQQKWRTSQIPVLRPFHLLLNLMMLEKSLDNDGIKPTKSSLTASKEAVSRTDGKATRQERPCNTVSSLINEQKLMQMPVWKKKATAKVHNSQMLMDQKKKKKTDINERMSSSSTSKDIQNNDVKQVHLSTCKNGKENRHVARPVLVQDCDSRKTGEVERRSYCKR